VWTRNINKVRICLEADGLGKVASAKGCGLLTQELR
jgi:hypothetical protein